MAPKLTLPGAQFQSRNYTHKRRPSDFKLLHSQADFSGTVAEVTLTGAVYTDPQILNLGAPNFTLRTAEIDTQKRRDITEACN